MGPVSTSSAAIPALAPVASLPSARFVTIDPSAVVPKVTLGILSQPASAVLWLALDNRNQNRSLEALLLLDNNTVPMEARVRFNRQLPGEVVAGPSTGAIAAQLQLLELVPRKGGSSA